MNPSSHSYPFIPISKMEEIYDKLSYFCYKQQAENLLRSALHTKLIANASSDLSIFLTKLYLLAKIYVVGLDWIVSQMTLYTMHSTIKRVCIFDMLSEESAPSSEFSRDQSTRPRLPGWDSNQPRVRSQGGGGMQKTAQEHR